ncbi:MAG TPA: hypothetical protein VGP33_10065, partial [Chloroflexota bacterium]|nr:hypothetical protein [Chloroflexota bacterium]
MTKSTDVHTTAATLYFLPLDARLPLKFGRAISGPSTASPLQSVSVRVRLRLEDARGRSAEGWGETPLGVQWAWPSDVPLAERQETLQKFCVELTHAWAAFAVRGHPVEIGHHFQQTELPRLLSRRNDRHPDSEAIPWLAALVCCSAFDIALHDAYGILHGLPVYETY